MNQEEPKRTIDERIDALTHSVELIARFHMDVEKQMAKHSARTNSYIRRLALLIFDHEQRLRSIEDKEPE